MLKTRVIPCLLLRNQGLVKTIKFENPSYIGDPINTIRIFNEKEVDELILLDITASLEKKEPNYDLISEIASECFMPLTYGGGIKCLADAQKLFNIGIEKISINTCAIERPAFIKELSAVYGSQSVIVSIDVKKTGRQKYVVCKNRGKNITNYNPAIWAKYMEEMGAGEIFLNSINSDGTFEGYDIELIRNVTNAITIPVVACGGAGKIEDFRSAVREGGASAVAAGSMFVYQGKHRAVLINFPTRHELEMLFK